MLIIIVLLIPVLFAVTVAVVAHFDTAPLGHTGHRSTPEAAPARVPLKLGPRSSNPMSTTYTDQRSVGDARAAVSRAATLAPAARSIIHAQAVAACLNHGLTPAQTAHELALTYRAVATITTQLTQGTITFHPTPTDLAPLTYDINTAWQ